MKKDSDCILGLSFLKYTFFCIFSFQLKESLFSFEGSINKRLGETILCFKVRYCSPIRLGETILCFKSKAFGFFCSDRCSLNVYLILVLPAFFVLCHATETKL